MGFIDDAKDNLTHAVDDVKDKAQDVGEGAKDLVGEVRDKLEEGTDEAKEVKDWRMKSDKEGIDAVELEEKTHGKDL